MIVVALLTTLTIIATRKGVAYSLVIAWALAGIRANQIENQTIVSTAEVSIAIVLIAIIALAVASRIKR